MVKKKNILCIGMQIICMDGNKYGVKVGGVKKLVPNLRDKVKYVVHYRNLQYYLSLRMK